MHAESSAFILPTQLYWIAAVESKFLQADPGG